MDKRMSEHRGKLKIVQNLSQDVNMEFREGYIHVAYLLNEARPLQVHE